MKDEFIKIRVDKRLKKAALNYAADKGGVSELLRNYLMKKVGLKKEGSGR